MVAGLTAGTDDAPTVAASGRASSFVAARDRRNARGATSGQELVLAYASQTGFIEEVVETTRRDLALINVPTRLVELDDLEISALAENTPILFLASTTGNGDAPFAAELFNEQAMAEPAALAHLRFGLLCAGDRSYENFCGFGRRLRDWLLASGARPLFEPIEVDCEDENAVARWREHVVHAFSTAKACSV